MKNKKDMKNKMKNKKDEIQSRIKTVNKKISLAKMMVGINRTKDDYENMSYSEYCRKTNSINTHGRKKYKHSYPTTSKLEWDKIEQEKRGEETSERKYIREISRLSSVNFYDKHGKETEEKEIELPKRKKAIILESENQVDFYRTKINPYNCKKQCIRIWKPENERKAIYVWVKKKDLDELEETINTPFGEMKTDDLIRVAMKNETEIYELIDIVE